MTNQEARQFITRYFKALFTDRDVQALDEYLHPDYRDDDIGPDSPDHIQQSKEYLTRFFLEVPSIGVHVTETVVADNVITAYLEWYHLDQGRKVTRMKGIGLFVMEGGRILKRHTFIYYKNNVW